ncbi:hypothetical protein MRX96_016426 [Rhipicephalus microplus]
MRLSLRKSQLDAVRDMLADVRWKALLLVFLTALGSEVFGCKPFDSVRRRRLMRLKGNFIKIQNQCKKQIFTSIKLVARDDIKKPTNACMKSTADGNAVELIDCWTYAVKNETGPYHATGSSESHVQSHRRHFRVPQEHRPRKAVTTIDRRPHFIRHGVRLSPLDS